MKFLTVLMAALLLGMIGLNANAQDVSVLETWADREGSMSVTDLKLLNINGNDCLMSVIEQRQSMNDNIIWGHNIAEGSMREWFWDASYGFQSLTKINVDGEDRVLAFTSGWKFPHAVELVVEDPIDNMTRHSNNQVMMPTELWTNGGDLNVSVSFPLDFDDRKVQVAVFRGLELENTELPRSVTAYVAQEGMHSFSVGGIDVDVKNRRVYAVAKWQNPGNADLLIADLETKSSSRVQLFDLPELGRQVGNIRIIGDFCYIASFSGDPGIYVYRMNGEPYPLNDEGQPTWTLIQRYKDDFEVWDAVYWMDFYGDKVYYAGSTHVGEGTIHEDGTITFDRGWDLDPIFRRSVSNTKLVYHDGTLYFNGTTQDRVYSTCVMTVDVEQ